MASTQSPRTVPGTPGNSTDLRVEGALLQLLRVLVDIAGNASSTHSDELAQTYPAVSGDDRRGAPVPAAAPLSRITQPAGCSATDSQLAHSHVTTRDGSLRPAGTEQH